MIAVWWWLHSDYMAVASVAIALLTLGVATWIALRQTAITKRQGEIAEEQHRIWSEQLAKRVDLSVVCNMKSVSLSDDRLKHHHIYSLSIANSGTKTARDIYWRLFALRRNDNSDPLITAKDGNVVIASGEDNQRTFEDEYATYNYLEGRHAGPIYPAQTVEFAKIQMKIPHQDFMEYRLDNCEWSLDCEDGRFPTKGTSILDLNWTVFDEEDDI